jgi:protein-disulfide isomerase
MTKSRILLSILIAAVIAGIAIYIHTASTSSVPADSGPQTAAAPLPVAPSSTPAQAQGNPNLPNYGYPFLDTSMLKPPTGAKVAVIEFQDLQCPACAHAFPIVHAAVAHYNIPLVERDFPLPQHAVLGSFDAAVTARYLQDKVSPKLADDFRGDVFASQATIANRDDMAAFTRKWFQAHRLNLPFVMDADGKCTAEVDADRDMGDRLNVHSTPCIFVVTQNKWVHVDDLNQLNQLIDAALAQTASASAPSPEPAASPATARS